MTDETEGQDGQDQAGETDEAATQPSVHGLIQYTKDLSFENPNPIEALSNHEKSPDIAVNCQIGVTRIADTTFEVALHVDVKASRDEATVFLVELQYAGLFALNNIPEDHMEPVLYVHCPTMLFPFVRQVVAEVTRNGGYPQLLLEMLDFSELYRRHQIERQKQAANGAENGGNGAGTA